MASALRCKAAAAALSSAVVVRRRLPLVGAFCVLTFGLCNISSSLSSTFRTGQSLTLPSLFRSKLERQSQARSTHSIRMAASGSTVPSIVVYVTVPNKDLGKKLAESIVREKLAACVNRVPGIESVYVWNGQIETDSEELLIIKTRESLLDALTEHVKANHEYETPEVIAMPIIGGSSQYLEWIKNSTKD